MARDNPETFADLDGHDPGAGSGSSSGPVTDFLNFLGQELVGVGKTAVNIVPETYNTVATVLNAETADSPSPANLPLVPTLPLTSPGQVVGADIATLGLVASGLTGDAPAAGTISENAAKGADSEARVLNDLGRTKNTEAVAGKEGKSIPDFKDSKTVGEIKDAKTVANTKQLRIQKEAAQQSGRQHELHTGTKTHVTTRAAEGRNESNPPGRLRAQMMNPKRESETLMNAMLPLAEKMLKQYGEFYPYGGYMKPDGTIVDIGATDPDSRLPKSKDLIYVLRSSFREMACNNQCKAVAIVFNVAVDLPDSNRKSDAIQVCVDHADGYSAEVFFPYQIISNEIVYDKAFAQEGNHDIFGQY